MKIFITGFSFAGLIYAGSAMAVDMPADGKAKCGMCHAIDTKKVGPAWKDVAAKYKDNPDAEKTLITHITKGGSFSWKIGNMPPRGMGANDVQIASLAKFILELKQ